MTHGTTPPGWYDDGQGAQRWWDGNGWTEHTQPAQAPQAPQAPQPDPHAEPTRYGGPVPESPGEQPSTPSLDKGTGETPPSDVTRVAPPRDQGFPAQGGYQPPATPGYPQPGGGYQQPEYGQQGYPQQGYPQSGGQPSWQQPYPQSGSGGGKGKLIAIIGGAVAVLVVVVVLAVVLLGGGGGPSGTVEDYFDTAKDGDCSVVEFASNSSLGTDADGRDDALDEAKKQCEDSGTFDEDDGKGCDLEVTDEKVDGKKATVDYEISGCDDEDSNAEGSFDLVEEDGEWRIDNLV